VTRTPHRRRLLAVLTAALATLAITTPAPADLLAHRLSGEVEGDGFALALSSVSPSVATGQQSVTITGEVINTATQSVPIPDVTLDGSFTALVGRDAIAAWAAGRTVGPTLDRLDHDAATGQLRPGGRASFRLRVPKPAASSNAAFGALPMLISAGGSRLTTFVTIQQRAEYDPLTVALVAPVTLDPDPDLLADYGAARRAAWQRELGSTGRIQRLLAATSGLPLTLAIDPTLLDPPEAVPDVRPTDAEAGAAWDRITPEQREEIRLRRASDADLRARLRGERPLLLPYADADLPALLTLPGLTPQIAKALTTATAVAADLPGARTDILWPADGLVGTDRVAALRQAAGDSTVRAVIGAESALAGENTSAAPHPGPDGSAVLAYDDRLSAAFLGLASDQSGAVTTQRLLADSLGLLAEFPGTKRSVLIALPRTVDAAPAALSAAVTTLLAAPWITTTDVDALIEEAPTGSPIPEKAPEKLDLPLDIPKDPSLARDGLTPARAQSLQRSWEAIEGIAQVRADGAQSWAYWQQTAAQILSSRWRADRAALRPVITAAKDAATAARDGVAVVPGRINFFADSGQVQITITNDLDVAVENVQVRLTSSVPSFRLGPAPAPVTIGPKSRATVHVSATALAAATVPIKVALFSPAGRHIGVDNIVEVRAFPTGSWFYWVIGAVAVLLFAAGRWRTRRRRAIAAQVATEPAPMSSPGADPA
jgi:hypothetical protein